MRIGQRRCSQHDLNSKTKWFSSTRLCHGGARLSAVNGTLRAAYFGLDCSQSNAHKQRRADNLKWLTSDGRTNPGYKTWGPRGCGSGG